MAASDQASPDPATMGVPSGSSRLRRVWWEIRQFLPQGGALTSRVWNLRHRRLRQLLVLHAVGIAAFGTARGFGLLHSTAEGLIPLLAAVAAGHPRLNRTAQSMVVSFGLLGASAILVHISGGLIEFHFHFFVMVALISLYQEWMPFLAAIGFVVLHHGTVGVLDARAVYNHPAAWANPWRWAMVHGGFILAMSMASVAAWRLNEFQALHDSLTRLPNRDLFRDRVEQALQASERTGRIAAVILFDLDGFKKVNDSLGHSAGDILLTQVGERLAKCVRASDVPARLGGDEFAVLLRDVGSAHDALRVADRVHDALALPFDVQGREVLVRASAGIGIASGPGGSVTSAEQLIRDADVAMYQAKDDHQARSRVFDPVMHAAALNRLENEAELRHAVERNELVLHYQPIVNLDSGAVTGVEALVRWNHPVRGMVPPMEFIPLAEETGLIVPLGRWVLAEACREVGRWPTSDDAIHLSVNLSTRQLEDPNLVPQVASHPGGDPFRSQSARARDHGERHDGGERGSDRPTPGSSRPRDPDRHRRLRDRVLLAQLPGAAAGRRAEDRSIVRACPGRGNRGGVAGRGDHQAGPERGACTWLGEGIEGSSELAKLRAAGCSLGQGYYFGRPVSGPEARIAIQAASRFAVDQPALT